jgi:hypothetical protein
MALKDFLELHFAKIVLLSEAVQISPSRNLIVMFAFAVRETSCAVKLEPPYDSTTDKA